VVIPAIVQGVRGSVGSAGAATAAQSRKQRPPCGACPELGRPIGKVPPPITFTSDGGESPRKLVTFSQRYVVPPLCSLAAMTGILPDCPRCLSSPDSTAPLADSAAEELLDGATAVLATQLLSTHRIARGEGHSYTTHSSRELVSDVATTTFTDPMRGSRLVPRTAPSQRPPQSPHVRRSILTSCAAEVTSRTSD
jgi:hypothetical protein